jgi:hypothetical protein
MARVAQTAQRVEEGEGGFDERRGSLRSDEICRDVARIEPLVDA